MSIQEIKALALAKFALRAEALEKEHIKLEQENFENEIIWEFDWLYIY